VLRAAVCVSLLAICLAGCSHGGSGDVQPAAADVVKGWHAYGPALSGDTDGDARPDRISVERRGKSCRFRIVVRRRQTELRAPLADVACGRDVEGGLPRLEGLAAVDPRPGAEIVVDVWSGASTEFSALWTVRSSRLEQLRFPACCSGSFPYYGSVGHDERVDCVAGQPGVIVSSSARLLAVTGKRQRLAVVRRFYRISGSTVTRTRSERHRVVTRADPPYPEWREPQPFPSCSRAPAAQ
jgi:hypothetical protein